MNFDEVCKVLEQSFVGVDSYESKSKNPFYVPEISSREHFGTSHSYRHGTLLLRTKAVLPDLWLEIRLLFPCYHISMIKEMISGRTEAMISEAMSNTQPHEAVDFGG